MVVSVFSQPVESLACCVTSIAEWQKRHARSAIALPSPAGNVSGEAARLLADRESPGRLPSAASPSDTSTKAAARVRRTRGSEPDTAAHLVDRVVAVAAGVGLRHERLHRTIVVGGAREDGELGGRRDLEIGRPAA